MKFQEKEVDRHRRVLVLPAGTEIGLEILASLKWCRNIEVLGAGEASPNHGQFAFRTFHPLANVTRGKWLDALNAICRDQNVDYIFPAHDDVIVALAERAAEIEASIISSPLKTCLITRSKSRTYGCLAAIVPVPKIFADESDVDAFPVLVKPDRGQGSAGVHVTHNPDDLRVARERVPESIICEYLPGEEFTVDCFTSRKRGLLFARARQRRRVRNGIAVNSVTVDLPEAWPMAYSINSQLALHGAWFFQIKRAVNGELKLLEVAPRIAGTMALHRVLGVNFAFLSILENEGLDFDIAPNSGGVEIDRALRNRFRHQVEYDEVYLDLDDTLIFNGKVNVDLICLAYRAVNDGKRIVLLTKHSGDLHETLRRFRLDSIFDEVIYVPPGREKFEYIQPGRAIFIDDSFSERRKIATSCGIPTFDSSMIEVLYE